MFIDIYIYNNNNKKRKNMKKQAKVNVETQPQTYSQEYSCKVDNSTTANVKVVEIPNTLEELRNRFNDDLILQFILRQVIAHSCFSAVRSAFKKGISLKEWTFTLPQKREASALNKLTTEQRKQLSNLSADKLEQLLQLLKD